MAQTRIRIHYAKLAALRYTGTLDMQRNWERLLRRAGLPVAYSQGFHPQARIQQASPLPLGFTGLDEIVDIWLEEPHQVDQVAAILSKSVPPGLEIRSVIEVEAGLPPLQTLVTSAEYTVTVGEPRDPQDLLMRIGGTLGAGSLPREWRGKRYDLRPLIEDLSLQPDSAGSPVIGMRLSSREAATGRPEEVLRVLDIPLETARIERRCLILH